MKNDALRDALRYFVDAGKLVLELGPIRTKAVRVVIAAEEAGTLWLACERSGGLAELLRRATEARVRFVQDDRELELTGRALCTLDERKVELFDHALLSQTLGLPHERRMLVQLSVTSSRFREGTASSGTHRVVNVEEAVRTTLDLTA